MSRNRNVACAAVASSGVRLTVLVVEADALDCDVSPAADLVVANAFADLVFPEALACGLRRLGRPGAAAYLPCTYAGRTSVEPPLAPGDDDVVFDAYGDALAAAGQHVDAERLVTVLEREGFAVDDARGDWRVALGDDAPPDDAAFAPFLADFVGASAVPRLFGTPRADAAVRWARRLRAALADGDRRHIVAENKDLLLRFPDAAAASANRPARSHKRGDSLAQYLSDLSEA
jgi:hypothetical protein